MKTLIAVPCMDTVDAYFARSLAEMIRVGDTLVEFQVGTLVDKSRNLLAGKALQAEADYILWLDSDMVFQPDLMIRLMADIQTGKDFVSALYHYRKPPYKPVIWKQYRNMDLDGCMIMDQYLHYPKDGLFEIEACGFGAVLMRTEMIEKVAGKYKALFDQLPKTGEDMSFCARARHCGYKMWADPALQLGHRGYMICDYSQWEQWQAQTEGK